MKVPDSGLHIDQACFPLLRALISYGEGLTTAAGAATGLTLVCADLANEPSYRGQLIKILSGNAAGQVRKIVNDSSLTGTVVFDQPVTDRNGAVVTITASTLFDILSVGVDSEILYYGTTTAAGDADGSTAIDTGLAVPFTVDDQPLGCTFRVIDCSTTSLESQDREIYDYDFGTSELFFNTPFTSQVPINTIYLVLRARPSSAGGPGPQPEPTTEETMWQLGWNDAFDVAEAFPILTEKWAGGYISAGAADGTADINTTTASRLYVDILAAAAAAAEYGVRALWPNVTRKWFDLVDASIVVANPNVTYVWAGMSVSRGVAWDALNYIRIYKRQRSAVAPLEDIAVEYRLAGGAVVTTAILTTTQDNLAFKIERVENVWRCYYSLSQIPRHHWRLALEIEDPANSLTDTTSTYLSVYNPEDAAGQRISSNFNNFEHYEMLGNLADIISLLISRGGALAYIGYCPLGMGASTTVVHCPNLSGFVNDCFNDDYQMIVMKNANSALAAPEMEMRRITDYVSATGTFTTEAFSQNVEASDIVLVIHNSVAKNISVFGIADAGSAVTQIRDAARTEADDWWNGQQILMLSGLARGQMRPIWDFAAATDDILVYPNFDAVPAAGDLYVILTQYSEIVPRLADDQSNRLTSHVIGRKDDTPTPRVSVVATPTAGSMNYLKALVARGMAAIHGVCDADMGASTITIDCDDLIGYGDDYFNTGFQMIVLKNTSAPGTSPEMEMRDITDYSSVDGVFTVEAFSANVEASDVILVVQNSLASQVSVYGIADAASTAATIRDAYRIEADNWWNGQQILMLSGPARGQLRPIVDFDAALDDIYVAPNFDAVPVAGDVYAILTKYSELVPRAIDDITNSLTSHVVGRKDDSPSPFMVANATAMRYAKAQIARGMAVIHGVCDADMGASTTIIDCDDLAGYGDDYFNTGFQMIVLRNTGTPGSAPEMEMRDIIDYTSVGGVFQVEAFSANVELNDVILVVQNNLAVRISVYGIADAGSTAANVRDAARTEVNDWWNGQQVMMLSGAARGQVRIIADFDAALDDIIPSPNFDAAVGVNDVYAILTQHGDIVTRTIDDTANHLASQVTGRKDDTAVPIMAAAASNAGYLKALIARGMAILQGTCNAGMAPSTTTIVSDDLIGYGDTYFANHFYLTVIKNISSAGATPENEARLITAYTSVSGTFTVDAFSANVELNDVFLILHESLMATLAGAERLDGVIPADRDRFDVGDATADTLRWASDYISIGTTDGTASIAGGKLNLDVLAADALPAEYGVRRLQTLKGRNWYHQADFSVTVTNPNANHVWAGLSVSPGIAWDANNYIRIYKRQNNVPVEDIAVEYRLAGGAVVTTSILATTQDTMAFKIERIGDIWRCYYSLAIGSNHHWWVLALEIEDATNAMTDTVSAYISVYNPKDALGQQITATADDWEYFINLAALESILTNISIKGGALAYLGYCNVGMAASATVISCANLAGFGDDAFNSGYQMVVLKNANSLAAAPEMERRDITDHVSATGTFTTRAFSANVEAGDIVLVVHVSVASQVATYGIATGGAAGTIVDTMRTEAADYWNGMQVVMLSGNGIGQVRAIYDFSAAADTLYVTPDFAGAVVAGDAYAILSHWTDLTGDDTAGNRRVSEVLGDKETAAVYDVDLLTSAMAYVKGLVDATITATGIADAGAAGSVTDAARAEAADWWNGQTLLMLTGAAALQKRPITDFAAGVMSVAPDFDGLPAMGDVYVILAHYNMIVPRTVDELTNALTSDVVGRKDDTPYYTGLADTRSLMRYIKALHGVKLMVGGLADAGSDADTLIDAAILTYANDYLIGMSLVMLTGNNAGLVRPIVASTLATTSCEVRPAFPNAIANGDQYAILKNYHEVVPVFDGLENYQPRDVIGNKTDTASDDPDVNNLSLMRLLKSLMRTWKCVIPNIDVSLAAIDNVLTTSPAAGAPDAENTIMDLPITAGLMYKLEDLVLKVSGYGTGTQITIQCWEMLNGNVRASYVNMTTVVVPTDFPITTYLSLTDLFGKPVVVGDGIAITAITDAGVTGALTCTYSYSTARVS